MGSLKKLVCNGAKSRVPQETNVEMGSRQSPISEVLRIAKRKGAIVNNKGSHETIVEMGKRSDQTKTRGPHKNLFAVGINSGSPQVS